MRWALPLCVLLLFSVSAAWIGRNPVPVLPSEHNGINQQSEGGVSDRQEGNASHQQSPSDKIVSNLPTAGRGDLTAAMGAVGAFPNNQHDPADEPKWTDTAQAGAALAIALLTIVLIAINTIQTRQISLSTKAAEKAARTAERALLELERPHIFVDITPSIVVLNEPAPDSSYVRFRIANYGRMPAEIIQCYADATQIGLEPQIGIFRDDLNLIVGPNEKTPDHDIDIWSSVECRFWINIQNGESHATPIEGDDFETFFRIDILYNGIGPTVYKSVFCWIWDHGVGRWRKHNEPRYNYRT
jgi:hypothetical protein